MDSRRDIKILGISGSLRRGSFNTAALKLAQKLATENAPVEIFDIKDIPPFNQDFESSPPEIVAQLKQRVREADAILFSTPEYNYSVPGVLKNAIDWASRPYGDNAWAGKPVAIMSASGSIFGGARAQYHLRQTFVFLDMHPINRPEVMIPLAQEKFDQNGELTDDKTREKITELLQALVLWTIRLQKSS